MLRPVLISAPATTPVTLAEAKANSRVDSTDEDALITALIEAATAHIDGWAGILGRCVVTQTWRQDFPSFPASTALRLAIDPAQSVVVKYSDDDDEEQTFSSASYSLHTDSIGPYICLGTNVSWPSTYDREDAVRIEVTAGYGAAADVPAAIKQAVLMMVSHWFEHREAVSDGDMREVPMAVTTLLAPYRRALI